MLSNELYRSLSSKFRIIEFVDLAECAKNVTTIYRLFEKNHKEYFEDNERFVFYTNANISKRTIKYIRHAAEQFDISRYFISVYCAGYDYVPIDDDINVYVETVESESFDESKLFDTDTICALPWMHLEIMNAGDINPCCYNKLSLSDNKNYRFKDIFYNGARLAELRQDLYNGRRSTHCQQCWEREDKDIGSLRQWRNKLHSRKFFTEYIRYPKLKSLVLRPSQICNFKCRICNDRNSSLWLQENLWYEKSPEKLQKIHKLVSDTKWFDRDPNLMQEVFDLVPDLNFLDIYGGEPLFTKQFYVLIEDSVINGYAQNQRLHFNTNGSIFPEDKIELMAKFKEVAISLSIDDIGGRFEYQRGGDWNEISANVIKFLQLDPEIFKISFLVTVSNLNLLYLDEVLNWGEEIGAHVVFNMLQVPDYFRFDRITQAVRDAAILKFVNHDHPFLSAMAADLKCVDPTNPTIWIEKIKEIDLRRDQRITDHHKMLADLMGYTQ